MYCFLEMLKKCQSFIQVKSAKGCFILFERLLRDMTSREWSPLLRDTCSCKICYFSCGTNLLKDPKLSPWLYIRLFMSFSLSPKIRLFSKMILNQNLGCDCHMHCVIAVKSFCLISSHWKGKFCNNASSWHSMCKRNLVKKGSQSKIAVVFRRAGNLFVNWFGDFVLASCSTELFNILCPSLTTPC